MIGRVYETETTGFLKHMKGGDIPFYVDKPEWKIPDKYFYRWTNGYSHVIEVAVGELMKWADTIVSKPEIYV